MEEENKSFLTVVSEEKCLLCEGILKRTENVQAFNEKNWGTLQKLALIWKSLHLKEDDAHFPYKKVYDKIQNQRSFGKVILIFVILIILKLLFLSTLIFL